MNVKQIELDARKQRHEQELAQLPRLNLGALLMPAIWGPAHGQWVTVLFYPIWLFADICLTNAVFYGGLAALLAATVVGGTIALTLFYALTAGPSAYLRVAGRLPIDTYLMREKYWTLACAAVALLMLGFASWYNIAVRLPAGPGA
ncbi:MAG: hypothetical protein LBU07_07425 [Coriobacteriales bacterium]|jgi:hypothetical protein|nr:hypothetical protein [Coriobacteriales bacterium]